MKVCGFTFVRNAEKFDYPVVESIKSALPVCDEFIVSIGNSEDNTVQLINSIGDPKITIYDSIWDETLREGGKVLAVETNKAFDKIDETYDWAFYLQADEIVHERYYPILEKAMLEFKDDSRVEGLLLKYLHFYGTYDYIADSRKWYRNEIRIIRNDKRIRSYKDAQGFRKEGRKLKVKTVDAYIYHYGWVKDPFAQKAKEKSFHKLWHDDNWMKKNIIESDVFDYGRIDSLEKFKGMHPAVMQNRIKERQWELGFDPSFKRFSLKDKMLMWIEKITGYRFFEYKNYRKI